MICLLLAGWRRRAPAGKTSFQGGESRSGVFGAALPPQRIVQEGSPYSLGPSLRMDLLAAKILDGLERWIRQADQALAASSGSSSRAISTSNGGGSQLAGSRGPWTSAELASRRVRRQRSRTKENALQASFRGRENLGSHPYVIGLTLFHRCGSPATQLGILKNW